MNEEEKAMVENLEKKRKEEFDSILEKIKKMSEAIELHSNVKEAISKEEIDDNYLKYIENSLEDKLFNDAKFNKIKSKVLIEVICPSLANIENFEIQKLEIADIGSHYEELENYIDKICIYDNKFICLFGVNENNPEKAIQYQPRKFSRLDMIEAICEKMEKGKTMQMEQYDEYYVITEETGLKVFSKREVVSLVKLEETLFDKIKNKLSSLFSIDRFHKKRCMPNIKLVYDTNSNRFETFEYASKIEAKNRMKALLRRERETIKNT